MIPYRTPASLLDELGITEPGEIGIEAIAQYCGATVLYDRLAGCEARLIGYQNRALITVRRSDSRGRERFSAGHELGHWMRDRDRVAYHCDTTVFRLAWGGGDPETRANRYAAELLLPESMVRPRARGKPMTFATVAAIATEFETSLTATAIRVVELGAAPVMLVCSGPEGRRWFKRDVDVPFLPSLNPGLATVARDLLSNSSVRSPGPVEVCADGWVDHPQASGYAVMEDSRRIGDGLVLSLVWWKDERQLLDIQSRE